MGETSRRQRADNRGAQHLGRASLAFTHIVLPEFGGRSDALNWFGIPKSVYASFQKLPLDERQYAFRKYAGELAYDLASRSTYMFMLHDDAKKAHDEVTKAFHRLPEPTRANWLQLVTEKLEKIRTAQIDASDQIEAYHATKRPKGPDGMIPDDFWQKLLRPWQENAARVKEIHLLRDATMATLQDVKRDYIQKQVDEDRAKRARAAEESRANTE